MAQRWFVSRGEHVYGPWSTEDVQSHRRDGNILNADVIWGIGTSHWVAIANWDPNAAAAKPRPKPVEIVTPVVARPTPVAAEPVVAKPIAARPVAAQPIAVAPVPAAETTRLLDEEVTKISNPRAEFEEVTKISARREDFDEVTVIRAPRPEEAWHLAHDGRSLGPFTRPGLIVELRRLASIDGASLWTKGMREWAPVVEFLDILNELGVNQRQHARAALKGRAILKYDGLSQSAPVTSISEGGLGLELNSELITGQIVDVEVQSAGLGAVKAAAEIRYCANGFVGLKFTSIDAGARANIARYVRQHSADAKAA